MTPTDDQVEQFAAQTESQDEAPVSAIEREEGKPKYLQLSATELNKMATKEWREQSAIRGPVIVPEWGDAALFCKRLSYLEQQELIEIYREHGFIGAFCYRTLNSDAQRIFSSVSMFIESMQQRWNPAVIERVVNEFAVLSRTQLTDKELGN